ncbi:hypothetical protein GE118_00420 [Mycoplasma sp. NEAQ87857]|uniref:hypothetical protein n=1 Tax=Mycoplasma sp. NEAQ87857 TaxID=2683967 RepID=UPI001315B9D9|nr:hypothetical protein [Mycoplasma sp. NEAQ87857]QGZ97268.1 hypothetical protein GE118_00420 [Mycoplasma sp. NEAQ87857]
MNLIKSMIFIPIIAMLLSLPILSAISLVLAIILMLVMDRNIQWIKSKIYLIKNKFQKDININYDNKNNY